MRGAVGEAMAALSKVSTHFRAAFAYRMPFIATHLAVRLVTSALFVPLIGLLLGTVVGFSGRSAVTDQDIARLLLTPAGAFTVLAAISLGIAAAVLDVTVMMHTLATREPRVIPAIRRGVAFVVPRFPRILRFSLGLLLRVLGIALPFVLAMAATAYWSAARLRHQLLPHLPSAAGPACRRHHRSLGDAHGPDPPVKADRLGLRAATRRGARRATSVPPSKRVPRCCKGGS